MVQLFLFKVEEHFAVSRWGLVAMPGIPLQHYEGPEDVLLLLKKPDGTKVKVAAQIFYSFPVPSPAKKMLTVAFPTLAKPDVPIGTEIWFIGQHYPVAEQQIESMSILIEKNIERSRLVDYVFVCDAWAQDPRYQNRNILIGQNRGLFRIDKETLEPKLLLPMEGDKNDTRFMKAATKIINEWKANKAFPEKACFISG